MNPDRRKLLRYFALGGFSITLGRSLFSCARTPKKDVKELSDLGKEIRIIDAHAHPDLSFQNQQISDRLSTLKAIKELGMVASGFAAVGDLAHISKGRLKGLGKSDFQNTMVQLNWWIENFIKKEKVRLVKKASDLSDKFNEKNPPGAILAIEGGDPLEGNPDRVNEFYQLGVRMITLVHYKNNELGDIMMEWGGGRPTPLHNGLSKAGRRVIERMESLGMVVDVAHAHPVTLKQIVEVCSKPLIDSHTSLCPLEHPSWCGRLRTWEEMELIVKKGGLICTWPYAYKMNSYERLTFLDWAKEIYEMKKRFGIEHIGLGTDGGGRIPKVIKNYGSICDLVYLVEALQKISLSKEEISAYMGGNFYRLLRQCIG